MRGTYKAAAIAAAAAACVQAHAVEFGSEGGLKAKVNGVLTLGTQVRVEGASPDAYSTVPSTVVPGVAAGKLQGQTGGSDLNYGTGKAISTVAKAVVDVDVGKSGIGLFVRGSAWKDFVQGERSMPYGNFPNGFTPNAPLSDNGFSSSGKFSNAELRDAFVYGSFDMAGGNKVDARLGRQVLNWGTAQLTTGGIGAVTNPTDWSSQLRPGALPFEGKLPVGMLSAKLANSGPWNAEGFASFEFRGAALPECGTYFDVASYAPQGCAFAGLAAFGTERTALGTGLYLHRNADVTPGGGGQFGVSVGYKSEPLATEFKGYVAQTHMTNPSLRMTVNTAAPGILASNYSVLYPKGVHLFGATFNTKLGPAASVYGEVAYRPNQPLTYNAFDIVTAFVTRSPASILALNRGALGVPVGGTYDAFDRFGVITATFGASRVFTGALGANRVTLAGELGISHVNSLPSTDVIRYGRQLPYNGAFYTGGPACVDAVAGKTCTSDGYVSSNAYGVRGLVAATYGNAFFGASLTPSLLVAFDIKGYSYDGTFSEGRTVLRPGVRADWAGKYFADLQYTRFAGGKYNLLVDRDYVSLTAGARF